MFSAEAKQEIVDMMGELFLANAAEIARVLDEDGKLNFSVKVNLKGNSSVSLKATAILTATTKKISDDIVKDLMPNQPKLNLTVEKAEKAMSASKTKKVLTPEEVLAGDGEES